MEWCVPENDDDDESGSVLNTDDLQKVRNNTILMNADPQPCGLIKINNNN